LGSDSQPIEVIENASHYAYIGHFFRNGCNGKPEVGQMLNVWYQTKGSFLQNAT